MDHAHNLLFKWAIVMVAGAKAGLVLFHPSWPFEVHNKYGFQISLETPVRARICLDVQPSWDCNQGNKPQLD